MRLLKILGSDLDACPPQASVLPAETPFRESWMRLNSMKRAEGAEDEMGKAVLHIINSAEYFGMLGDVGSRCPPAEKHGSRRLG